MTTVVMPLTSEPEELNGQAADFAWVAEPSKRRRLGVAFDKNVADALVVASVSPGSEAERIGLKPGDKLLLLDGRELYDMLAMHRAAAEGGPDQDHVLVFQRGGEKMERKFRFKE
jgi:S1-C subfamily serine protease